MGNHIEVVAEINEYYALTELTNVRSWSVLDSGSSEGGGAGEEEEEEDEEEEEEEEAAAAATARSVLAPVEVHTGDLGTSCNPSGER
jgi:hypothetical protein